MSENNGHDARARRAVELFAARYGWAETLRRTLACADSHALPFDLDEAVKLVNIQCGEGREGEDHEQ